MPFDMPSYSQSTDEMDMTSYKPNQRASRLQSTSVNSSSSIVKHDPSDSNTHHAGSAPVPSSSTSRPSSSSLRPPSPKPFTYDLTRKGKTWGKLTLLGDPALSRSNAAFVEPASQIFERPGAQTTGKRASQAEEGATVRGEVQLNLDNPETIHSVRVTVRGQISIGASAPFTFLDTSTTPWSREMGDPRGEGSQSSFATKLHGTHTWPFAIPLPRAVTLPVGSPPRERRYALPANFWERHEPVRVRYYVILQVGRGRWRAGLRLPVEFTYVPWSVPSPTRQLAYEKHTPPPPPDADMDGWHTAKSVVVSGLVGAGRHEVEVICCVSLQSVFVFGETCTCRPSVILVDLPPAGSLLSASSLTMRRSTSFSKLTFTQLSYTRGSVLPLALTFESHDTAALTFESHDAAALDLLSAPTAPVVRLRRRLRYKADIGKVDEGDDYEGEGDEYEGEGGGGRQSDGRSLHTANTTPWTESTTVYDLASWWPQEGAPQHTYRRCLDGEIHLKEDLKPTTGFAQWRVEYEVVLFPFDIPSFVGRDREPLVVQPLEIATAYGSGPRPHAVTAPVLEFAGAGV
ncbi:hypothetical protein EV714DRAFT_211448 [Schizophyllum commune]